MYSITISPISKTFDWGSNRGFTLIELMASLVLLAMLTTIFGLGVVGALKIYAISEENVHLAQKGQMAMARINRELMELTAVIERNDDDPFIVYENLRGTGGIGIHAIRFDSANHRVLLYSDLPAGTTSLDINDDADLLLDNVADFSITYLQGSSPWTGGNQRHLSHIETRLSLLRPRGIVTNTEDFTSRVYLRNTINYGGEAPPTEPPEPPSMSNYSCFITAAAIRDNNTAVPTLLMAVFSIAIMLMVVFQCTRLYNKKTNRSSGSALIAVIVAVLMFSAIAAALLPLVSSSGQQAVAQDYSEKAYLLAESGFRYAAGQYINAGSDAEKLQVLGNLHNTAYTTDDQGRFALHLYAYFFEVQTSIPINTTSISTIVHGALPSEIEFLSNVDVSMTTGRQLLNVQNISISGNTVIFNLSTGTHHAISQGMLIYPAAVPSGSQQLSNGGSITAPHLDMFPSRNGYITVAGRRLNYRYKDMNTSPNRLVDVVDLNDPDMNLSIENTDHIVLNQHVQLVSTGFTGQVIFRSAAP